MQFALFLLKYTKFQTHKMLKVLLMNLNIIKWRKALLNQLIHHNDGNSMNIDILNPPCLARIYCERLFSSSNLLISSSLESNTINKS